MTRKKFTEEEMKILSENPYTISVTENTLSFTIEFKELFWDCYCKGMSPSAIISQSGYDPQILGETRIEGLKYTLKKAVLAGKEFTNVAKPALQTDQIEYTNASIKELEQKVKYLEQEIAYLKKISSIKNIEK